MKGVCAVVGGQFGSEGKGAVVAHIARDYDNHVRVGAANAGHTLYTLTKQNDDGYISAEWEKHVMQQLPCAAYANPDAKLWIGPGALITHSIFERELRDWHQWRLSQALPVPRVFVDGRAHMITDYQVAEETETDLAERIGSTSATAREGIGVAQADRVMRAERCMLAATPYSGWEPVLLTDVPRDLHAEDSILLEGTQGASLSITTGAHPFITSRNTTAAGLAADCGVAPTRLDRVIMVVRTYPIRVAGNSGPFWFDSAEIEWSDIGVDAGKERTTVTKKVRRVATMSYAQLRESAILNGATEIALMFCDYVDPDLAGVTGELDEPNGRVGEMVRRIEDATGVPVRYLGTGPHSMIHLRDPR